MKGERTDRFSPLTLGQIRGPGCRDLLVYRKSIDATILPRSMLTGLPDETVVRSLGPRLVCTACGLIGADVRPDCRPLEPRAGSQPTSVVVMESAASAAAASTAFMVSSVP